MFVKMFRVASEAPGRSVRFLSSRAARSQLVSFVSGETQPAAAAAFGSWQRSVQAFVWASVGLDREARLLC